MGVRLRSGGGSYVRDPKAGVLTAMTHKERG